MGEGAAQAKAGATKRVAWAGWWGEGVWQEEESTSLECPLSGRVRKAGSLGETQNPRRLWGQREGWSPGEQGASPQRGIGPRSKV